MGPTLDTTAMEESDVELAGASVACATDGNMSTKPRGICGEMGNASSEDAAPNTPGCSPSLRVDAVRIRATDNAISVSDDCFPEQPTADEPSRARRGRLTPQTLSLSSAPQADTLTPFKSPDSCVSSDSEATITAANSENNTRSDMRIAAEPLLKLPGSPTLIPRPDPLNFLEPDSPAITPESIHRSIEASTIWKSLHPARESPSEGRSDPGSSAHNLFSPTDPATAYSRILKHSSEKSRRNLFHLSNIRALEGYGAPRIYPSPATHPHIPAQTLPPALPARSGQDIEARDAGNFPTSGYHLLASHLSSGHSASPLQPIYRRFETLQHRVLLHLQDELSELEEQLLRLEATDAEARRAQAFIPPASRRADSVGGGELQWHRTDILGKIGYKLEQYSASLLIPSIFIKYRY